MFVDVHSPNTIRPTQLDNYLSMGWFRLGQNIFTTNFLCFSDEFYSAYWLRVDLQAIIEEHKILRKNNNFKIEFGPFTITDKKEELFNIYRNNLRFHTAESLSGLLFGGRSTDIFNTYEVCVYHDAELIGVGVFDLGNQSAEGIVSFYHPDYKKHSLGKYLILLKMMYLKQQGYKYFYPGYFAPNYKIFDYKIDFYPNATEYLDVVQQQWLGLENLDRNKLYVDIIKNKLEYVEGLLIENRVKVSLLKYDFFDLGMYANYTNIGLLDAPMFLFCFFTSSQQSGIIVYDLFTSKYQLLLCERAFDVSQWNYKPGHFNEFILRPITILAESKSPDSLLRKANSYFIFE